MAFGLEKLTNYWSTVLNESNAAPFDSEELRFPKVHQNSKFFGPIENLIHNKNFKNFILLTIIINAIALGLDTSGNIMAKYGNIIRPIDQICSIIFIIEITLKLLIWRFNFFSSSWNILDFFVVFIGITPSGRSFSTLRALRVLRVFRFFSTLPRIRRVITALFEAIPSMNSIFFILAIIFYTSAVITTSLFGESFPEWFGTLAHSLFSLFQIMTLEGWPEIARPVIKEYPYSWMFFLPFIVSTAFIVINLFIAILVSAIQSEHDAEMESGLENNLKSAHEDELQTRELIQELRTEIVALKQLIQNKI